MDINVISLPRGGVKKGGQPSFYLLSPLTPNPAMTGYPGLVSLPQTTVGGNKGGWRERDRQGPRRQGPGCRCIAAAAVCVALPCALLSLSLLRTVSRPSTGLPLQLSAVGANRPGGGSRGRRCDLRLFLFSAPEYFWLSLLFSSEIVSRPELSADVVLPTRTMLPFGVVRRLLGITFSAWRGERRREKRETRADRRGTRMADRQGLTGGAEEMTLGGPGAWGRERVTKGRALR